MPKTRWSKKKKRDDRRSSISEWDLGIATIESILKPGSKAASALSKEQAAGLSTLRNMLLRGHTKRNNSFVPTELLEMAFSTSDRNLSSEYIAKEFGGLREPSGRNLSARLLPVVHANSFVRGLSLASAASKLKLASEHDCVKASRRFTPQEWKVLSQKSRQRVRKLLAWDSLGRWDFNILDLVDACGNKSPLVLLGWAVLGSPYAQDAMLASCEEFCNGSGTSGQLLRSAGVSSGTREDGYEFAVDFGLSTETLCNFLRAIEAHYKPENPYHNNIHAADVVQTTHALLQLGAENFARGALDLFSILIAAAVHDVGHPGKNNAYQVHARTDVALLYNDRAVLENMHAAWTFKMLLGSEQHSEMDVLGGLEAEEKADARRVIIDAVLGTCMSDHFSQVSGMRGRLSTMGSSPERYKSDEDGEAAREVLSYVLHMADISNAAKPAPLFEYWADRCLAEFFVQGDAEKAEGLPLSPLCDRDQTDRADSQIGFITYIVQPSYGVLGELVPLVAAEIEPVIESNLAYWTKCHSDEEPDSS